jgi:hypothetical protein
MPSGRRRKLSKRAKAAAAREEVRKRKRSFSYDEHALRVKPKLTATNVRALVFI